MLNKRVLIIANNPLSDTNSNGRTLKNFFAPEDRDKLAQMYIHGGVPDFSACSRYFRVSDRDVLRSLLRRTSAGRCIEADEVEAISGEVAVAKRSKKTPFRMLVRSFLWERRGWRKEFYRWVESVNPEVVLLQAGDSPFLYHLARKIAQSRKIPLVIYNSEDYCFQKKNYMQARGLLPLLYPIFRRKLKKAVKKALLYASCSVYISEDLKDAYDAEYGRPSEYIYTATTMQSADGNTAEGVFSYLGNFGYGRYKMLVKIAKTLSAIDPEYKLDVYGKIPNEEVAAAFETCPAIRYRGLVDYGTVCRVMRESTLLFHAEGFDKRFRAAVRHGFTTKIADSLASGSCFVIFAPPELSCTKYLAENECACVISEEADLEPKLREVIENKELRAALIARAKEVAKENHDAEKNRAKMARILNEI